MGRAGMNVAGVDFSSHAIDVVLVDLDDRQPPRWHRYPLLGQDAFDRARSVADAMPGRSSVYWDNVLAVGIEEPAGRNPGVLFRIQGAVLAQIPARMLVTKWMPSQWRKAVGLAGNAAKPMSRERAWQYDPRFTGLTEWDGPPLDACDALCVALATRQAITRQEAA